MRRDLAETAWACAIWYGLRLGQNIPLNEDERNRVEELVGRVFSSNGIANEGEEEKHKYIEGLLCKLIDNVRLEVIRYNLAANGAAAEEDDLWKEYRRVYRNDPLQQKLAGNWQLPYKEVSCLTWDDVSGFFAMGEYFHLDMLPLMGGVDWIGENGKRTPLSDLGGIRVLSRLLDEQHGHFVWGIMEEWNIGARPTVFDVMFTGNHVQPLTEFADVKTGYQEVGDPPFTGRNQLQWKATLETEWREDEGREKSLTRARIKELLNLNQRNRTAGDPIVVN
ncbi:MAG: hypothetical protein K2L24_03425 [Opitutales bacterium]|nr:hypothetical protein [Opitutales bacterium]